MKSFERKTLAQIVADKLATASVFEKYNLDYCCHGRQTLFQACNFIDSKYDAVTNELSSMYDETIPANNVLDAGKMTLSELVDLILTRHHRYVKEALPRISQHLQKVESKHGLRHPNLSEILQQFDQLTVEFENHMFKEEKIIFPRIKMLEERYLSEKDSDKQFNPRMMSDPIRVLENEHDIAGAIMQTVRKLSDDYTPPADACNTFVVTYHELKEFEADLHQHVHLENNILFPGAMAMMDKMVAEKV